ncbi:hypothetical protein SAMD00019534_006570 [Acytostelium subglobosum LB1]|uniref:hypothetical protein n=1 Tax=Acytostelium subglobosum LB1 TaxID=1410327 RepID=UPI0006450676|nr:hypothetical protein SAMD00019534_006570 [Acytostelium subglobosum LB1]GAM17482.1 hypothetical protein SAMD00019534_006570 [Acytostelium subglobosum LB1]|eukprot:XP_012759544.1 hypothetical protein SAMD00019534_006570 [Acytostelium subglobosum LB1]
MINRKRNTVYLGFEKRFHQKDYDYMFFLVPHSPTNWKKEIMDIPDISSVTLVFERYHDRYSDYGAVFWTDLKVLIDHLAAHSIPIICEHMPLITDDESSVPLNGYYFSNLTLYLRSTSTQSFVDNVLGSLPATLTNLSLTGQFKGSLENVLPTSIRSLAIRLDDWNLAISGTGLPPHLNTLHLGHWFNHPLTLPSSITEVKIGLYFAQQIDCPSLQSLIWTSSTTTISDLTSTFPDLRDVNLTFEKPPVGIPYGVEVLSLNFDRYINHEPLSRLQLPSSITALKIQYHNRKIQIGDIPPSVTSLTVIGVQYDQLDFDALPSALRSLSLQCVATDLPIPWDLVNQLHCLPKSTVEYTLTIGYGLSVRRNDYWTINLTRISDNIFLRVADDLLKRSGFIDISSPYFKTEYLLQLMNNQWTWPINKPRGRGLASTLSSCTTM